MNFTGFGYDVHRLEQGRKLVLGGVEIPGADRGAVAHSDGDVAAHALCDALLGAAGLDDIGHHFPDTDERYRGIDSMTLLKEVVRLLRDNGFVPVQCDCTIVLEAPKIGPHRPAMRTAMSAATGIPAERVSVKATTHERLGPIGAGEGVAAFAVASIERS
jgi:2-C-methyl-D-erythritol 2,4-cyclodiphosphate synthase